MKKKIEFALHILAVVLLAMLIVFFIMQGTYGPAVGAAILFALNIVAVRILWKNLNK